MCSCFLMYACVPVCICAGMCMCMCEGVLSRFYVPVAVHIYESLDVYLYE